jgi:hypothetical protein
MKFNLNKFNLNKNRQKISHHFKQASSWSGKFDYEFHELKIKNPPCECSGEAEISYEASYDSGTWYDPPESDIKIDVNITSVKCINESGREEFMNPDIMEAIEEQLENDEHIKEMAFNEKGLDEGPDRDD